MAIVFTSVEMADELYDMIMLRWRVSTLSYKVINSS